MDNMEREPEPPSPEQNELEVFPLEVWEVILSKLTHQNDLTNCYNATVSWRKLLLPKRMTFMTEQMSRVLLIVDNRITFTSQEILRLRLVSHSWKATMDHFLQHHPDHFEMEFRKSQSLPLYHLPMQRFKTTLFTKFNRFLRRTSRFPNADPFFSRTVRYHELAFDQYQGIRAPREVVQRHRGLAPEVLIPEQRNAFRNILERFGTLIWHAQLIFTMKETEPESFYLYVQSLLCYLPNLHTIWIWVDGGVDELHTVTPELKQLMVTEPLPPLPALDFLGIRNVAEPLESALLLTYSNVKNLCFQNSTGNHPSFPPDSADQLDFSGLQKLRTFNYSVTDIELLHNKFGGWPLTHLNLRWVQVRDLNVVFQAVSSFSNTLKHLMLEFRGELSHNFMNVDRNLELPHLEIFKLTSIQSHLNNLDFLAPCVSLKELELCMWIPLNRSENDPAARQPQIRFDECVDKMYTSNIWEVFTHLQKIRITTVTNNRLNRQGPLRAKFFYSRANYLSPRR